MQTNTTETIAAATVEARRFLARVKPRTLRTDTGRAVTTTEIAEGLVKRADVESAVLPGKRPTEILCGRCKVPVVVAKRGKIPQWCRVCWPAEKKAKLRCATCPALVGAHVLSGKCRSCSMRDTCAAKTKAQLSERSRRGASSMTPEQRRSRSLARYAAETPAQRAARSAKAKARMAAKSPEQKSEAAKRAAKKAWVTRRARGT
jgi:hypothetical protein